MTKLLYRYDSNIKVSLMGWCCVLNTTPPLFTGRTPNDDAQLHLQTSRRLRDAVSEKRRSQTFSHRASATVTLFSFSSYKSSHKFFQFYSIFFLLPIRYSRKKFRLLEKHKYYVQCAKALQVH
jgi:hypothetical protein